MRAGRWGARPLGVECVLFDRLVELATRFQPSGWKPKPERQMFKTQPASAACCTQSLKRFAIKARRFGFLRDGGFCVHPKVKLGFGPIECLDIPQNTISRRAGRARRTPGRPSWTEAGAMAPGPARATARLPWPGLMSCIGLPCAGLGEPQLGVL